MRLSWIFLSLCHFIVESSPSTPHYHGPSNNNVWDEDEEILARTSHRLDTLGDPLVLTSLIKSGHIGEAQKAARVKNLTHHVVSYSGFLTVNSDFGSNLFFWFFPAQINSDTAPLILWLQGGPGESALFGLFTEHGPFLLDDTSLAVTLRPTSWTRRHSVIYMDSPVGAGFSHTSNDQGYAKNQEDVARDLYEGLLQFFELFPGYRKNNFFVAGESYGGKYVPAISWKIHRENIDLSTAIMDDKKKLAIINLKGLAMGNAFTDPVSTLVYSDLLFDLGLIDRKEKLHFTLAEERTRGFIEAENYLAAFEIMDKLLLGSKSTSQPSYFEGVTGLKSIYNLLWHQDPPGMVQKFTNFVQQDWVRSSIHVGNRPFLYFDLGGPVASHMESDIFQSVKIWLEELLDAPDEKYRILFYTGQLDICVGVMANNNLIKNLRWGGAAEFEMADKKIWRVANPVNGIEEVAGYSKNYKSLTQLIVRNAGHRVPYDQPEWALDMISRFTATVHARKANFSWTFDNPRGN